MHALILIAFQLLIWRHAWNLNFLNLLIKRIFDILNGITTNERIRGKWKTEKNIFDHGWKNNCGLFFCEKTEPSLMEIERIIKSSSFWMEQAEDSNHSIVLISYLD